MKSRIVVDLHRTWVLSCRMASSLPWFSRSKIKSNGRPILACGVDIISYLIDPMLGGGAAPNGHQFSLVDHHSFNQASALLDPALISWL